MSIEKEAEFTLAQQKGRRLRMLRAFSGLSRQELYEKTNIATSTMDTWESGRVELTDKSAGRVCDSFMKCGIICTKEWLLTGNGVGPRQFNIIEQAVFANNSENSATHQNFFDIPIAGILDDSIRKELQFFLSIHSDALYHIVKTNFMNSRFRPGDCVAGKIFPPEELIDHIVIVRIQHNDTAFGKLTTCSSKECSLFLGNKRGVISMKYDAIAKVIWHRIAE